MKLKEILPAIGPIKLVVIGAMDIGESSGPIQALKDYELRVIGFEPNQTECDKLMQKNQDKNIDYLPYAIGDGQQHIFHITNTGMTSSLFQPNMPLLNMYWMLGDLCKVTDVEVIDTHRLDDIAELQDADYLTVDTQGAEGMILENGTNLLKGIMVLQTEVEFVELYKNQPLFAEIDQICRKNAFQFHRFLGMAGRTIKPLVTGNDYCAFCSQMLWSDAVYIKDILHLECISSEKLLKLVVILHEVYASSDVCNFVLQVYDERHGTALAKAYREKVLLIV